MLFRPVVSLPLVAGAGRGRTVPGELRELFGWVFREGVTNAVRHSWATHLRVQVTGRAITVEDDGVGAAGAGAGRGSGLAERVVDPALAATTLAGGTSPLTGRERDVLVAARDGSTVGDIAARLFLSEGTVRNYLSSAIAKTASRNRMKALRTAEQQGWL